VADDDAAGGQHLLDHAQAEWEAECAGRPARSRWCKSTAMKE
jgi:hypothetical protein